MNIQQTDTDNTSIGRENTSKHVVIVGGGITGLSAGWYLQQEAARQGFTLSYTILEESNRWGGKIWTEEVGDFGDTPFILEAGADALLTRKPWALDLVRELGLTDRLLPVNLENNRTFVLHRGQPFPLPDGLHLLVPTQMVPFLQSPLFSFKGKLRAGLDLFISPRRSNADETLESFIKRRLGTEMLDKLGEPLLAGVYNGDPKHQSIHASFPQFPALERQYGSLIRGIRAKARERADSDLPPFVSFKTGMNELVNMLVARLEGDLCLNTSVISIERLSNSRYLVVTSNGGAIESDAVILAIPASVASKLLYEVAPESARHLKGIPYSSIGSAYLAFRQQDVAHPLNGFGLLIPRSEHRQINGIIWASTKWKERTPAGHVLCRVFFGGPRTRETSQLGDSELLSIIRVELQSILGVSAMPLLYRVYRWEDGYPQYNLGHLERVEAAETALPIGIIVTGSAFRGVGVPDCVCQARDAASRTVKLMAGNATLI